MSKRDDLKAAADTAEQTAGVEEDLENEHRTLLEQYDREESTRHKLDARVGDANLKLAEASAEHVALRAEYAAKFSDSLMSHKAVGDHVLVADTLTGGLKDLDQKIARARDRIVSSAKEIERLKADLSGATEHARLQNDVLGREAEKSPQTAVTTTRGGTPRASPQRAAQAIVELLGTGFAQQTTMDTTDQIVDIRELLTYVERYCVVAALLATRGDVRAAASVLSMPERTLYRRLDAWGVDRLAADLDKLAEENRNDFDAALRRIATLSPLDH